MEVCYYLPRHTDRLLKESKKRLVTDRVSETGAGIASDFWKPYALMQTFDKGSMAVRAVHD